jgi:heme-degrading monooxygenase HmoA
MIARTSSWAGSPEALMRWIEQVETAVKPFVAGVPGNAGAYFLVDVAGGRALTLSLWESEEAAVASDDAADESRARTIAATGVELLERGRYAVTASV